MRVDGLCQMGLLGRTGPEHCCSLAREGLLPGAAWSASWAWQGCCPVRAPGHCLLPLFRGLWPHCCAHTETTLRPCHRCPLPTGVVMVFSTSAFGAYFKLTQGSPSNSSHMELLAPISVEPASASLGLAWLAVGSVCLFTAGKRGSGGGGGQWTHVTLKFLWLPVRSCPVRLSITWVPLECSWL